MRTLFSNRLVPNRLPALMAVALAAVCTLTARPTFAQTDSGSYGPVVAIVSPEYADVLKGLESILISITPRRYPARSIELLVDGKAITGVLPAQTKFKWDTKLFIDGPHTLGVRVTDTQGFIGQSETTVYINNNNVRTENDAPILSWMGVQNGQNLSGTARIRLTTGGDFGVKYVFLNLNSAIAPDIKPPLASWMTNRPPYEFSLDTSKFKDGLYVLDAYAWDAMENERVAPRLTVGFYNNGLNPTFLQPETTPAPQPAPAKEPEESQPATTSQQNTNSGASTFAANPATNLSLPQGTYTVTTRNGWISSTPVQTGSETPAVSQRVATLSSARISEPSPVARTVPTTSPSPEVHTAPAMSSNPDVRTAPATPLNADVRTAPPTFVAPQTRVANRVETSGQPGVTLAGSQTTLNITQISSATAPSQNATPTSTHMAAKVSEPTRIARAVPAAPAASATRVANRVEAGMQPGVTLAGQETTLNSTQISSVIAPSQSATPTSTRIAARVSEPGTASRIALAAPSATETAFTQQAPVQKPVQQATRIATAPEVRWTAPARFDAAKPESAVASFLPLDTPASLVAATNSATGFPDAMRGPNATRLTSPRLAALPPSALPKTVTPRTPVSSAQFSLVNGDFYDSRIVFTSAPLPLRITNTPSLPTLPQLAFLPDLKQSRASSPLEQAAILVAPSPDEPVVHVALRDETLVAIAQRYKLPLSVVATANDLPHNARIKKGEKVLLPKTLLLSYNGQAVTGDVAPFLIGSTSVAPFRFLFEQQGGTMKWDDAKRRVTARNANFEVTIEIGSDKALVNQEEVMMDMAAFLLSGRTMVPVRFFEKALKAKVEWEPSTGRIFVAMTP